MLRIALLIVFVVCIFQSMFLDVTFAETVAPTATAEKVLMPDINCHGLPGCSSDDAAYDTNIAELGAGVVKLVIQYTAVLAVIALMLSGIMYMVSGGEEEKTKKAKNWILWSIVAVVLSMSAWFIITTLNNIDITV